MREFQLIKKILKPLTNGNKAAQNLADDTAKISLKNSEELIISKDIFVEDVHFLKTDGAFKIASKLLRTNLSDLATAGATPLHYMLGFCKSKNLDEKFYLEFARGLKSVQDEFDLCLIGGDTSSSQKLFFSVTIFGSVKKGQNLLRSQAKNGDLIFVSGKIGDAFLGLEIKQGKNLELDKKEKEYLLQRHFFPTPRVKLGKKLSQKKLSRCAIDVSDGLLSDLRHICEESKLDAEIFLKKIPLSKAASKLVKSQEIKISDLISGGDDYELIFAVNKKHSKQILKLAKELKLDLTCIGIFKKQSKKNSQIILLGEKNQKLKIKKFGYEHF